MPKRLEKDLLNIPEMKRVSKENKLAIFGQFSKDRVRQDSQKRPKHRKLFRMQKSGLKKHPIVKHTKNSNISNLATFGHYEKDVVPMQMVKKMAILGRY